MPSKSPTLEAKGRLTLAQLASYDDVLTDAMVDRVRVAMSRSVTALTRDTGMVLDDSSQESEQILPCSRHPGRHRRVDPTTFYHHSTGHRQNRERAPGIIWSPQIRR